MPMKMDLNLCELSGRLVDTMPWSIMTIVSGTSLLSLLLSLYLHPLPSFSDPDLGFETRGSELSKRLISFENLLNSRLVQFPPDIMPKPGSTPNTTIMERRRRREVIRAKPIGQTVKFCLGPSVEYSQVVMSGRNLWLADSIRAMCQLETALVGSESYNNLCERKGPKSRSCCLPWSLPNYVAFLNNRSSCHHITEEDVAQTKKLVDECGQYFLGKGGEGSLIFSVSDLPRHCRSKRAVFNITFFLLDSYYWEEDRMTGKEMRLENVLVILPIGQSRSALSYYRSLRISSLHSGGVKVSAINLGVREAVFSERLLEDSWLLAVGLGGVAICFYLYTGSWLLMLAILLSLLFSLCIAYFLYTVILGFSFFPFINLLSSVVVIGVGGDAGLILCKAWSSQVQANAQATAHGLQLMSSGHGNRDTDESTGESQQDRIAPETGTPRRLATAVYRGVAKPLALTSLSTAAAFFASYISSITAIACFGVFSGMVVLSNLVVTWWWLPCCLVITRGGAKSAQSSSDRRRLGALVLKSRILWLVLFPGLTVVASFILWNRGGLPVQDRSSLQLLLSSDPIEKFHLSYSQRFWTQRLEASKERFRLRWVWGVLPLDEGDALNPESRGSLVFDDSFDFYHPDTQLFLYNLCRNIRREAWYGDISTVVGGRCFPESLTSWMSRRCVGSDLSDVPCCGWAPTPPYPASVYKECAARAARSVHRSALRHPVAGPYFLASDSSHTIRALVIEFDSNLTFTTSYDRVDAFYKEVEEWTRKELSHGPSSLSKGWFLSDLYLYDLQLSLRKDTFTSLLMAGCLVLLLLLMGTRDPYLAGVAVLSVSGSTICVAALLLLLGWRLDVLESTTASLAVGLAVDFTIHYALHYKKTGQSASETLDEVGGPTLVCMITSCLAGLVMMPSQVLPYRRVAVFLLVLMPVSWIYSTLCFLSLLPKTFS